MDGWVAESVVSLDKEGNIAPMFLTNKGDQIQLMDQIETAVEKKRRILPASIHSYPYRPYKVPPDASLNPPTLQEAWDLVYEKVDMAMDHERVYKLILTDAIIATYIQDFFFAVPYIYFVGDNKSGKSHMLNLVNFLAYRPLLGTDIPPADLIRYLPVDDYITYTILEDEFQKVEKNEAKLKIWKSGYKRGAKVPRIKQNTDVVEFFNPFGMKFAAGENLPRDKGLNQRFIVIQMVEGQPEIDYWGDVDIASFFDDLRLKLLLLRLDLLAKPKPSLEVKWLRKRSRELYLPLLITAYNTKFYDEIEQFVKDKLEEEKREVGATFEAFLTEIVLDKLIQKKALIEKEKGKIEDFDGLLAVSIGTDIWSEIKERLDAVDSANRPWVLETDQFGTITKHRVGRRLREILDSRIEIRKCNGSSKSERYHIFKRWKLERAAKKYGLDDKLKELFNGYVSTNVTFSQGMDGKGKPGSEVSETEKTPGSNPGDPLGKRSKRRNL